MRSQILLLVLGLLVVSQTELSAQQARVGVLGGASLPLAEMRESREPGWEMGGSAMLEWTRWAIRTDFTYSRYAGKVIGTVNPRVNRDLTNIAVVANLLYLAESEPLRRYLLFGGGLHRAQLDRDFANPYGWVSGVQAGAGVRYSVGPVSLFTEARWGVILSDYGTRDFKNSVFIPISVGVLF